MPIGTTAAIITGAATLAGSGANAIAQGNMNKKNRRWSKEQRDQQNAFNLAQYQRENQYNSPREQMARFAEAGLNPNLIYGGEPVTASAPQASTAANNPQTKAPSINVGSAVQSGLSAKMQAAQILLTNENTEKLRLENLATREGQTGKDYRETDQPAKGTDYVGNKAYNSMLRDYELTGQIKEKSKQIKFDTDFSNLKSRLAKAGFTTNDPKMLRIIIAEADKRGLDIAKLTIDALLKLIN